MFFSRCGPKLQNYPVRLLQQQRSQNFFNMQKSNDKRLHCPQVLLSPQPRFRARDKRPAYLVYLVVSALSAGGQRPQSLLENAQWGVVCSQPKIRFVKKWLQICVPTRLALLWF